MKKTGENFVKRLLKELVLTTNQANFIKSLVKMDYTYEKIATKHIEKYGNKFNLSLKKNHPVFNDLYVFGKMLVWKSMEKLGRN